MFLFAKTHIDCMLQFFFKKNKFYSINSVDRISMSELRLMHKHAYLSICKITDNNAKTNAVITQTATEPQGIILYPDSGKEHFLFTLKT